MLTDFVSDRVCDPSKFLATITKGKGVWNGDKMACVPLIRSDGCWVDECASINTHSRWSKEEGVNNIVHLTLPDIEWLSPTRNIV